MGVVRFSEPDLERTPAGAPAGLDPGPFRSVVVGELGGLTQYGVRIETLPPGSASSVRHWHDREDEFLWVIDGAPTLVEDSGARALGPGDACAWPAGRANGHRLENRSDGDVRFLIAGWRDPADVCRYSGLDRMFVKAHGRSGYARRDGTPIDQTTPVGPFDDPPGDPASGFVDQAAAPVKTGSIYPPPYDAMMAGRSSIRLGQAGGLTQFGANVVILAPGAKSSLRHWHRHEDEFVLVTEGHVTLVEDAGPTVMAPGDCAAFPAGVADGHHFINHTDAEARFLVLGSKAAHEVATYSDVDLVVELKDGAAVFTHRDGSPYRAPA